MLGLRLDEPLAARRDSTAALDAAGLARVERLGLASRPGRRETLALTPRGRFLGGGVTAELLA